MKLRTLERTVQIGTLIVFGIPALAGVLVALAYLGSNVIMWGLGG